MPNHGTPLDRIGICKDIREDISISAIDLIAIGFIDEPQPWPNFIGAHTCQLVSHGAASSWVAPTPGAH